MEKTNKLLILSEDAKKYSELITKSNFGDLIVTAFNSSRDAESIIGDCNIIMGEPRLISPIIEKANSVEWIQSTFAGVNELVNTGKKINCTITGIKGFYGPLMSEYVFGYVIALERKIFEVYHNQKRKEWNPLSYRTLSNRLIGICGTGSIGQRIAQTAKHFGMHVWGYRRTFEQNSAFDKIYVKNRFKEFLEAPDYIVITLPITDETFHLFDYDSFLSMKNTAVLINVGRGAVVEEKALERALGERLIGGAILDVFKNEPLSKKSPLWEMDNVIITPHHSAIDLPEDIVKIFSANYKLFVENKPLNYIIDVEKGY